MTWRPLTPRTHLVSDPDKCDRCGKPGKKRAIEEPVDRFREALRVRSAMPTRMAHVRSLTSGEYPPAVDRNDHAGHQHI